MAKVTKSYIPHERKPKKTSIGKKANLSMMNKSKRRHHKK